MSSDASGFGLSQINPLRYRGYYYDQETGLYYLQTRYYDPKVRRFLNVDDTSVLTKDPEQLTEKNLYAYCDDNPVMYRDDSGFGLSQINPLRYRGYYYDQETGLYYLQTRYYDPKVRRFLNVDDTSVLTKDPEQLTEKNLYAYCDDNPVMYRDDAGMFVITAAQVGLGVLGMVTNVATCYIAAKATGQEFGIGDLVIAAAAGFVGGYIKNNFYATVASVLISGVGTTIYSLVCGDNLKTALWKGGVTIVCTAVSVSSLIGVKSDWC